MEKGNKLVIWYGADRRIVMYPCNDNKLLNFNCIHPESESHANASDGKSIQTQALVMKQDLTRSRVEQGRRFRPVPQSLQGL